MPTMSKTPDRRECPVCQKIIATQEVAGHNTLAIRKHGGSLRRASWQESLGRGPQQKRDGSCDGSGHRVPRIVEVWRAVGIGAYPSHAPTRDSGWRAEGDALWIVREGINGNKGAKIQRFDVPTQKWVTERTIGRA